MTVTTAYPATGAASPVDGYITRTPTEGWAAKRDATAGTTADTSSNELSVKVHPGTTSPNYVELSRAILLFDLSSVPDGDSKDSATLELVANGKNDAMTPAGSISMVTSTPASNSTLATGDYSQFGTTKQAADRTIAGITVDVTTPVYNAFTLNATGLGNISLTGISKFGLRVTSDNDNAEPTWSSDTGQRVIFDPADEARPVEARPKLVLTHTTPPVTFVPKMLVF